MEFTARIATGTPNYPLPVTGTLNWQNNQASIDVGSIPIGHIIVPSFSQLPSQESRELPAFVVSIHASDHHPVFLQRVPAIDKTHCAKGGSDKSISTHIDCFHTHADLSDVKVMIEIAGDPPQEGLFTVSVRPLVCDVTINHTPSILLNAPRPISQMTGPKTIRQRICSPTAVAMCLAYLPQDNEHWLEIVAQCHDPISGAYGSWPLAVRVANQHGVHGAVETFTNWQDVHTALSGGQPIVCSINFGKGRLKGAPLEQTGGHLVVLYGSDENHVWVMDPAAQSNETVARTFDLQEFSQAWLRERGAAYIFSNHAHTLSH